MGSNGNNSIYTVIYIHLILFIGKYFNNRNGAARSGLDVAKSIKKSNNPIVLIYINSYKKSVVKKDFFIFRSPQFKLNIKKFNLSEIVKYLDSLFFDKINLKRISQCKPKLVIGNSLSSDFQAKRIAKYFNLKSCLIVRESTKFYKFPEKTVKRINSFDHIVFVSSNIMKKWIDVLPALHTKSIYIPNTIEESSIKNIITMNKDYYREKLHFSDDEFNIVIIGKFIKRKNQELILKNLEKFIGLKKKIKFHFIGKSITNYGNDMKKILKKSKGNNQVLIHGWKNNSLEYIYAANCLLLTATSEASPRVIYESMALKTPVIASNIDGVPELIKDNKTGFLYENNNINDLFLKIDQLLKLSEITQMVENANRYYYDTFSNKIHQKNYNNLLQLLEYHKDLE